MILPELVIPSHMGKCFQYTGMDSIEFCKNREHFVSYPHKIEYIYNSRGFRDSEWPTTPAELQESTWCVGDSFTVGLGSPLQHTWPAQVAKISAQQVINVSMNGASNDWISRITELIVKEINPRNIIVMWSYTHRREHPDTSRDSERRRLNYIRSTVDDDWNNFLDCHNKISALDSNIIEFTIPEFHPMIPDLNKYWNLFRGESWPTEYPTTIDELNRLPQNVLLELQQVFKELDNYRAHLTVIESLAQLDIISTPQLDLARDGNHFDRVTADWVAALAAARLT